MRTALLLVLSAFALACGAETSTPPPTASASAPSVAPPLQRSSVIVTAWAADPAIAPSLELSVRSLLTATCATRDPGVAVRLRGRTDASGEIAWRADDATDPELARCLWDPILRRRLPGAGDFDVRASLGTTALDALPPASGVESSRDWTGLACTHRESADCPPDHTCPQFRWAGGACPP